MNKPVILVVDDDPQVLAAVRRDLRGRYREQYATLSAGSGHWNSPIVADGRIALPEGDANDHATTGVLDIWSTTLQKQS